MNKKVLIIIEQSTNPVFLGHTVYLGPLYILSYLEAKGVFADFWDRQVDGHKKVNYADYDIVGFSVNVNNVKNSLKSAAIVKARHPAAQVVFGGPFATAYPEALIQSENIDAVVAGEGEQTFFEYVSGTEKSQIKGLHFKENGNVCFTGAREWNKDLDSLPFPAIHRLERSKYNIFFSRQLPVSSIITSRGCPYKCTFCFHNMGHEWRERSPENVVDEIEWQVNKLGVKELVIVDDNLTFNRDRAEKIFDEIIKRNIKVSIQCTNGIRADLLDRELLKKAHAAGVWVLSLAPETGSAKTLEKLNKRFKLDDVSRILKIAKEIGMATEVFLLVGLPWETESDLRETLQFAEILGADFVTVSRFIPFPGIGLVDKKEEIDLKKFSDNSYVGSTPGNDEKMRKILAPFYFKFYLSPRRFFRVCKILKFYSPSKLVQTHILKSLFLNFWTKLKNCFN